MRFVRLINGRRLSGETGRLPSRLLHVAPPAGERATFLLQENEGFLPAKKGFRSAGGSEQGAAGGSLRLLLGVKSQGLLTGSSLCQFLISGALIFVDVFLMGFTEC